MGAIGRGAGAVGRGAVGGIAGGAKAAAGAAALGTGAFLRQAASPIPGGAAAMTAALGNETVTGSANLTLNTLNVAQATLGQADPAPDANALGQAMTMSLGTAIGRAGARADPTGQAMTAGLGTVEAIPGQEVPLTGFPVEARLSSAFNILIHVDVQVTGLGLTMNQGSGSALIWNEVNTGSAPITPPGWQEVAA